MSEPIDLLQKHLKQAGQSLTAPRRVVFNTLLTSEPLSMTELSKLASGVDRASIYRTIALFERLGIIQRLQIGWKYKIELTDEFINHHHHLSCLSCGRVIPLSADVILEKRLLALARSHQFAAADHQLEIRGICADCSGDQPGTSSRTKPSA